MCDRRTYVVIRNIGHIDVVLIMQIRWMDFRQARRGNCKHVIHDVILDKLYGNEHYQHGRSQYEEVVVCVQVQQLLAPR
jgi:hypothetical protein